MRSRGRWRSDERDASNRSAARVLHADGAPAGTGRGAPGWRAPGGRRLGAGSFAGGRAGGDGKRCTARPRRACWTARWRSRRRLRSESACCARPLARRQRRGARAACVHLEEALGLATDPRERAEIALEVAETYAALFRWVDAVDVIERALAELGDADEALAARLEGELVVCGLHDARRASRVAPTLERLSSRSLAGSAAEALAVARGMAMVLAGRPAEEAAAPLEAALSRARRRGSRTGIRAPRCCGAWSRPSASSAVEAALRPMLAEVEALRERARARRDLQHARPAQAAAGSASGGGRCRASRAARVAGGGLRARARVRRDRAGRRRGRGR